jgi:hypothetical protein
MGVLRRASQSSIAACASVQKSLKTGGGSGESM